VTLLELIIFSALAFTVAFLLIPVFIKLLERWRVFDSPGKHKIHEQFKPSMGGAPIVIGVGFAVLIALPMSEIAHLKYYFIAIILMFITGLRDDILTLTPRQKMLSQFLPVIILIVFHQVELRSMYELAPHFEFHEIGAWAVTFFTLIILTNAFNLIDGIDGLAGTIGVIILLCLGLWFHSITQSTLALLAFSFAGATLAFLYFNWQPSKIFMGDTGALTIGFVIASLAIQFINLNFALDENHPAHLRSSISSAVCILIIPIFDTVRVIIIRLMHSQSPFKADKNHLHHELLALNLSHAQAVIVLATINAAFIALAWILRSQPDAIILLVVAGTCLLIQIVLVLAKRRYVVVRGKSGIA